jgi:hypothetical protein
LTFCSYIWKFLVRIVRVLFYAFSFFYQLGDSSLSFPKVSCMDDNVFM